MRIAWDVQYARDVFAQIGLELEAGPLVFAEYDDAGNPLPAGATDLEAAQLRAWYLGKYAANVIPVFYVASIAGANPRVVAHGRTVIDAQGAVVRVDYSFFFDHSNRPGGSVGTPSDTLAHELGHALLNRHPFAATGNEHAPSPEALMCDGATRKTPLRAVYSYRAGSDMDAIGFQMVRAQTPASQVEAIYDHPVYVRHREGNDWAGASLQHFCLNTNEAIADLYIQHIAVGQNLRFGAVDLAPMTQKRMSYVGGQPVLSEAIVVPGGHAA